MCRVASWRVSTAVAAAFAIFRRQHHQHRTQLFHREALEPARPHRLCDQDRVLAVHAGCEKALVSGTVRGQKAGFGEDPAQAPELARVLVHLPAEVSLPALELFLEGADLAVALQVLAKVWRAHDLELPLPLEQASGLHLEALHQLGGATHRPRSMTSAPPAPLGPAL